MKASYTNHYRRGLRGHTELVLAVAFAPDGRHLASAGDDDTVRVWDWHAPRRSPTLLRDHRGPITGGVAFAPDGRHVAGAGADETVRVWDWRQPRTPPRILRGHIGWVTAIAFAPDGRHVASGGDDDDTVGVWDWRQPPDPTVLSHAGWGTKVAFAPDGRHLASADPHGTVRVWDSRYPRTSPIVLRHGSHVFLNDVAFIDDGRYLATAGQASAGRPATVVGSGLACPPPCHRPRDQRASR